METLCKVGEITYTYDDKFIYAQKGLGEKIRLDLFDQHYYKLRVVNNIPILEIDGLRMQLVKNFKTPLHYSKEVLACFKMPAHSVVLDSCMGLGYTALEAAKKEAVSKVLTCEISEAVIELASINPFSQELYKNDKIEIVPKSVIDFIVESKKASFDAVIHDPPRFSHAPELYSQEFYTVLSGVMKKDGQLYHYVGSVGKKKGRDIAKDTATLLDECGFIKIQYKPKLQAVFAIKG